MHLITFKIYKLKSDTFMMKSDKNSMGYKYQELEKDNILSCLSS